MAPILLDLFARRVSSTTTRVVYYNGGAIGGGVFATIIIIMLIIFICVFIYEHNKAKRLHADEKIPISKGRIFKDAALVAVTFGLIWLACCSGGRSTTVRRRGPAPAQAYQPVAQGGGGGEYVPAPMPAYQPQMDYSYQPEMDYTPVSNAAQAPIQ